MKQKRKRTAVKENNCLNCGEVLKGNFCYQCGQKAYLNKENFFHLAIEFISDYFHFDGKFFTTMKGLFLKPGLITKEYIDGKRKTYLNPIQMYIFMSAVFFIIAAQIVVGSNDGNIPSEEVVANYHKVKATRDSIKQVTKYKKDLSLSISEYGFTVNNNVFNLSEYDSLQKVLPKEERDGWLLKFIHRKLLKKNDRYPDPSVIMDHDLPMAVFKSLPKAFFILLPAFAFIQRLFYRKKSYFDHVIFSLHYHCIGYVLLLIYFLGMNFLWFMEEHLVEFFILIMSLWFFYLALSNKAAFQQSWRNTIFKTLGVAILYSCLYAQTMLFILLISMLAA